MGPMRAPAPKQVVLQGTPKKGKVAKNDGSNAPEDPGAFTGPRRPDKQQLEDLLVNRGVNRSEIKNLSVKELEDVRKARRSTAHLKPADEVAKKKKGGGLGFLLPAGAGAGLMAAGGGVQAAGHGVANATNQPGVYNAGWDAVRHF